MFSYYAHVTSLGIPVAEFAKSVVIVRTVKDESVPPLSNKAVNYRLRA